MRVRQPSRALAFLCLVLVIVAAFQNCGKSFETGEDTAAQGMIILSSNIMASDSCLFDGREIKDGGTVLAYLNTGGDSICVAEQRVCDKGILSGSYLYSSCAALKSSCLLNGQTILHGQTTKAYKASTVAFGQACVSEGRLCDDGVLSGSYTYPDCSVDGPASCQLNGITYAHGASVTAFQASTVAAGQSCVSQVRTCGNGNLSGSYAFASCSPSAPAACQLNGMTYPHGASVTAFHAATVPLGQSCEAQVRTCNNGVLSGSYAAANCAVQGGASCQQDGVTLTHGNIGVFYAARAVPGGSYCSLQVLTCSNGNLPGADKFPYRSCKVDPALQGPPAPTPPPKTGPSCVSMDGQVVPYGQTVTAYQLTVTTVYGTVAGSSAPSTIWTCSAEAYPVRCLGEPTTLSYKAVNCAPNERLCRTFEFAPGHTLSNGVQRLYRPGTSLNASYYGSPFNPTMPQEIVSRPTTCQSSGFWSPAQTEWYGTLDNFSGASLTHCPSCTALPVPPPPTAEPYNYDGGGGQ